jgi:hypothetical protein
MFLDLIFLSSSQSTLHGERHFLGEYLMEGGLDRLKVSVVLDLLQNVVDVREDLGFTFDLADEGPLVVTTEHVLHGLHFPAPQTFLGLSLFFEGWAVSN